MAEYFPLASLRGTPGRDGVNAVPTDQAVAGYLDNDESFLRKKFDQIYGTAANTVRHGTDPLVPRPNVKGPVFWIGSVEPVFMINGDVFIDSTVQAFSPRNLPGLHAWYNPRTLAPLGDGATIDLLQDASGRNNHMLRSNGAGTPKYSAAGIPGGAVAFDGSSIIRTNAFAALSGAVTVMVNAKVTNSGTTGYIIGGSTASDGGAFGVGKSLTALAARRSSTTAATFATAGNLLVNSDIVVFEASGTVRYYRDGALLFTGATAADPLVRWALGGRFASGTLGNAVSAGSLVGDVIFAAYAMTAAEVPAATAWLQGRKV